MTLTKYMPLGAINSSYFPGRVSVIIPTYNYGHFVIHSIRSALRQPIEDLEIIVVDDGSTDSTREVVKKFGKEINYINQDNQGLSSARNTGLAYSTGEFIQFLDADDIMGKDTIEVQLKFLKENPNIPISVCRNKLFDTLGTQGHPNPTGEWRLYCQSLDVHLCYFNIAPPHAFLTRREVINAAGRFDTKLKACEDYDFWLRSASLGFIPHYNPKGLVYYRKHPQSMSASIEKQTLHDVLLHKRLSKLLREHPEFPDGHRLEGVLAFTAGVLKTVNRLEYLNLEYSIPLLELVLEQLQNFQNIAKKMNSGWSNLSTLFFLRIVSSLNETKYRRLVQKEEILTEIQKIASSAIHSRSRLKLFTTMIRNSLQDKRRFYFENKEIRYHLKKFILRPTLLHS